MEYKEDLPIVKTNIDDELKEFVTNWNIEDNVSLPSTDILNCGSGGNKCPIWLMKPNGYLGNQKRECTQCDVNSKYCSDDDNPCFSLGNYQQISSSDRYLYKNGFNYVRTDELSCDFDYNSCNTDYLQIGQCQSGANYNILDDYSFYGNGGTIMFLYSYSNALMEDIDNVGTQEYYCYGYLREYNYTCSPRCKEITYWYELNDDSDYGFWQIGDDVTVIGYDGYMYYPGDENIGNIESFNIRPVITISKSQISN